MIDEKYENNQTAEEMLESIANKIGIKIVKFKTIDEIISQNITFGKIIDTPFFTEKDKRIIQDKSYIK